MPDFIATYDLKETSPDLHGEFIKQARARKWTVWILVTTKQGKYWYKLPNTTLRGRFVDRPAAYASLKEAAAATKDGNAVAKITKLLLLQMAKGSYVISDDTQTFVPSKVSA